MQKYPHSTTHLNELSDKQGREMIELALADPEPAERFDKEVFMAEVKAAAKARLAREQRNASVGK